MKLFNFSKNPPTHKEKVHAAYRSLNEKMVEIFFPKKEPQADRIICSLAVICGLDLDKFDDKGYSRILQLYTDIFIRKKIAQDENPEIIKRILLRNENFISSKKVARNAVVYTMLNRIDPDFVLNSTADFVFLMPPREPSDPVERPRDGELAFYFQDPLEMITFGAHFKGGDDVVWLKGDKYINLFRKGYLLDEIGQFEEAIDVLMESLLWNPVGISARFEICEAYIHLHNLELAKRILFDMANYLIASPKIARFYRRIGFIETEEENYLCAAACFLYSKAFEDHGAIETELSYIEEKGKLKIKLTENDIIALLKGNNIPVLDKPHINDE